MKWTTRQSELIILFLLSLIVFYISSQLEPIKWWDETVYLNLGRDLSSDPFSYAFKGWGDKVPDLPYKPGFRPPLLPYAIAALYMLSLPAELFIPVMGAMGVVVLFLLVEKIYDRRIALLSSLLLISLPIYAFYSGKVLSDILVTVLTTISFFFFWLGFEKGEKKFKILCSFTVGLTVLAKYTSALIIPIFFIYLFFKHRSLAFLKDKINLISLIVFFLTLAPLFFYGYVEYGNPIGPILHAFRAGASYWGGKQPWSFFFQYAAQMFSPLVYALLLFGLFVVIRNFKNNLLIVLWFSIFFVFLSWLPHKEDRFFLPLVPAASVIVSIAISKLKNSTVVFGAVLILSLLSTINLFEKSYISSHTEITTCFLDASNFLKNTEQNAVIFTDSSAVVYYYTNRENHYYWPQDLGKITELIKNYYRNRPIYMLFSKDDSSVNLRQELNKNSSFKIVYRCPEGGNLAVVYRYLI